MWIVLPRFKDACYRAGTSRLPGVLVLASFTAVTASMGLWLPTGLLAAAVVGGEVRQLRGDWRQLYGLGLGACDVWMSRRSGRGVLLVQRHRGFPPGTLFVVVVDDGAGSVRMLQGWRWSRRHVGLDKRMMREGVRQRQVA